MTVSPRTRRWLLVALELALAGAIYLGVRAYLQRDLAHGNVPPLAGTLIDGTAVDLARVQEPVVIYFWATWCPICRAEHPSMESLARDHRVIAIATQSGDEDAVRDFVRKAGWHLPVWVDEQGLLARAFGVRAVPAFFVVDGAGRIRFAESGYTTGPALRLRLWLVAHAAFLFH